jgi:two-component system cell cycle sensor histidine kinase PleC
VVRTTDPAKITNKVNKKHEGTGLGLPLSKLLVELMKGEFIIESELGKGTMVKIIIPESKGEFNI